MAVYRFNLENTAPGHRPLIARLNKIFSPIPITVTDNEMIIGICEEAEEQQVWRKLYDKLGHGAHCV
ncbi:hypothetical protein [Anaeroselena agilis]|uniref:Uncharacterized protein n=1 Tax=Anaeroselena agilis TaxID=3063788 RepID=A0ABU3NZT2_9FIRM|nr:hypothetical protein [Selenomonadales bacterium 4137-cl]